MEECFFDATKVEPAGGFDPIPEDDYEVMIVKSENKANRSGTGTFLKLTCQIVSGPYEKRLIWAHLNLNHPNQQTVQIAQRELSAICHAVGVLRPLTKEALHNIPVIAHIIVEDDNRGGKTNTIKSWKAKPENAAAAQTTGTPW